MPRVTGFLRILPSRDRWGRPVDPDYGVDEGELPEVEPPEGEYPDQGLPGRPPGFWGGERPSWPARPGQGLPRPPRPGRPIDPDWGWGGSEHPDQGLPSRPRPPHVWPRPPGGGLPVDPSWGVGGGRPGGTPPDRPDHGLPIWPSIPGKPDNSLPPVEGVDPPPTDPPPGTIWPPLPPNIPPGKAIALVAISGVGYRYAVITIPTPPAGGAGGTPPARPGPTPPPTPKA
jgi:hypothetical protein